MELTERSFLILGTGVEDFWHRYKAFSIICGGGTKM